jgi:hypothetical protein
VLYNPNLAVSAVVVNEFEEGVVEVEPEGGWERQLLVRLAVEKTNALRAMYPGDDVRAQRFSHGCQGGNLKTIDESASSSGESRVPDGASGKDGPGPS